MSASREGYARLPNWLIDEGYFSRLSGAAVKVYVCLLYHANREHVAWPKTDTIAAEMGLCKHSVIEGVRELETAGLVRVERRPNTSHCYTLADPRGAKNAPQPAPERGAKNAPQGAKNAPLGVQKMHPNNTKGTKPTEQPPLPPVGGDGGFPANLNTSPFREAWERWLQHRREKRKPVMPTEQDASLTMLAEWGESRAITAVTFTIARGYIGLMEPPSNAETPTAPPQTPTAEQTKKLTSTVRGRKPLTPEEVDGALKRSATNGTAK